MKKSQKERIEKRLYQVGKITRNECLRNYISRLGAIICVLKEEGWEFETKNVKGDYVYIVKTYPIRTLFAKTLFN